LASSFKDGADIAKHGFFDGYNGVVWTAIVFQAVGGLLSSLCINYADNIAKNFATSISIVISFVFSVWFFNFNVSFTVIFENKFPVSSLFRLLIICLVPRRYGACALFDVPL
jgi:UDP-sugar transporter A1/2/3